MAANSSSCAVCVELPAERDAAEFGIHQHRAIAVVPGQPQQSGLPGAVSSEPLRSAATVVPARRAMASKISPVAESPASMPRHSGMDRSLARRRKRRESAPTFRAIAMMQVDVPTTLTTSPIRTPAPIASQCASNAPTGIGMPARRPSFPAHSGDERAGDLVRCARSGRASFARTPAKQRIDGCQEILRTASRRAPAFHIHLWPIAQTLRGSCVRIGDAAQHGRDHVAMLQRRDECGRACRDCAAASAAAWRIPTRTSRRRRTSRWPASPCRMRRLGDLRRFLPGAVIAPEIVVVERLESFADRNDARAGGVERDCFHLRRRRRRPPRAPCCIASASAFM